MMFPRFWPATTYIGSSAHDRKWGKLVLDLSAGPGANIARSASRFTSSHCAGVGLNWRTERFKKTKLNLAVNRMLFMGEDCVESFM